MTFQIPPRPTPRERYTLETEKFNTKPGTWDQTHVTIWKMYDDDLSQKERIVGKYDRSYRMLRTFEPFRQGEKDFALISPNYTKTAVMDLQTGDVIAEEKLVVPEGYKYASGFCPVGFYVPDWWEVHYDPDEEVTKDMRFLPGGEYWTPDDEWPVGDFGFVWGCYWGDDTSWKVQYLDLSLIQQGEIRRDDRFGYVALATGPGDARDFIDVSNENGHASVKFDVEQYFDLEKATESERSS